MTIYSHSRLSTFEQCPKKFKYKYLDKLKPEIEKTIETHLGSAVHKTLEWIYKSVKEMNKDPKIDDIIIQYTEEWQKEFSENILIVKKQFTARDYFNKGIQFLVDYYSKHSPFKDGTIACEKGILIELEEGEYKIQGFIDRLVYNLETGEYEIHDYKTGNLLPKQEHLDQERQLALYSIAIKEIYGNEREILLVWHFLAHNKIMKSKRTNSQLENLKKETIELIKKVESTKEFPRNKSMLCNWCEYKNICFKEEGEEKEKRVL
ncbi:MAG: PD-(D/E)XK nuclease family protein [Nanoarchaeota archaeon]